MILKKLQQEILNIIIMMIETMHFLMILLCLILNFLPEIHIAVLKKDTQKNQKHDQYLYITYLQFEKSFSATLFQ